MVAAQDLTSDFAAYACQKLGESLDQIEKCLGLMTVEQIWHRPNDVSNAIGNLVLHLRGNIRLWVVATLSGEPFDRDRPAEFNQRDPLPTAQIFEELRSTVAEACRLIEGVSADRLAQRHTIQGYEVTALVAVFHAVEHFSLHTGQIVYATKSLAGLDLSRYDKQGRRQDGGGP